MKFLKRRHFAKGADSDSLAFGVSPNNPIATRPASKRQVPEGIYRRLGLQPLINAAGTYTPLSGSLMAPEVVEAMCEASQQYVSIPELLEKSGEHLAKLLSCEAALVTSGAAGAVMLGTAACVTGDDLDKVHHLPEIVGMKNEVIIQKAHRFSYDHAVRNVGVRMIEIENRKELEAAINPCTAMMLFLNSFPNRFFNTVVPKGRIDHEEWIEVGKKHGIPTFNDCAADVPPVENLTKYTRMGFDLVTFSGGKALRGPQSSGLLLGRKDLIRAALLNNYPNSDAIGRPCKVGKEEVVGLVAAIERYLKLNHDAEWKRWELQIALIDAAVKSVPGVETEYHVPPIQSHVPHLKVCWNEKEWDFTTEDCMVALREGDPPIEVGTPENGLLILSTFMMNPGEERIVARQLQQVLATAHHRAQAQVSHSFLD